MNPDEPPYWCAHCNAPLPTWPSEEETCDKCHHTIESEKDYYSVMEWVRRIGADSDLEHAARADGLIK